MQPELSAGTRKVLVVDDKPNNLSLVTSLLRPEYEVLLANNGERAIFIAKEKLPNLILLDIMMPGMSGFEVCEVLKSEPSTRDIPVIFLTARHDGEDFEKAYDIGAVDYITKPINAKELIARVRTHLTISEQRNHLLQLNQQISQSNENLEAEVSRRTTQLVKVLARLEDQNEGLARFSHIISHNLRGPVASAIGLMRLFNMENMADPGNASLMPRLDATINNIDLILKDLSSILEIRENPARKPERFSVVDEVQAVLSELADFIEHSSATVNTDIKVVEVYMHRPFIHQILHHLLHNAIQFHGPDRTPVVTLAVKAGTVPGQVEFHVTDNGMGIEHESLPRIFEPYKRLHYSVGGRGLGLYIVKTMVEAMQGRVTVESEPGKGSGFTVVLAQDLTDEK